MIHPNKNNLPFNNIIFQVIGLLLYASLGFGQDTIFHDQTVVSYTNTDTTTVNLYGPIDISGCRQVSVSVNYSFSQGWEGPMDMEKSSECAGCSPAPFDQNVNCNDCWDFFYFRISRKIGGGERLFTYLVGGPRTEDNQRNGGIISQFCVKTDSPLEFEIFTQTTESDETIEFTNILVTCSDEKPIPIADPNPVCIGDNVQLNDANTHGLFTNWTWTGPNGFSSNKKNPLITNFSSANQGTYVVTADDNNMQCPMTDSIDVILAATINGGQSIKRCGAAPFSFNLSTLQSELNNTPGLSFEWYEDRNGMSHIGDPTSYPSTGGTVYVSVFDSVSACFSDTVAVSLKVNPEPSFSITPLITICEDQQIVLDTLINPSDSSLDYTFHESKFPALTNEISGPVTFSSDTTISVIGSSDQGCRDTQYVELQVISPPEAPLIDSSGPFCEGDTIILMASQPIIPVLTYTWNGPNGYSATGFNQVIPNATLSMAGEYKLTTSRSGCSSPTSSINVDIIELPSSPIVTDSISVCLGDSLILTALSDSTASYSWVGPSGFISSTQNPLVTPTASNSHMGTYTVTPNLNGCSGRPANIEVTVNDTPEIVLYIDDSINCNGGANGSISVHVSNEVPNLIYDWSNDLYDGMNVLSDLNEGTYIVTVTDGNLCSNTASVSLTDPPELNISCSAIQQESGVGEADGIGQVTVNGGSSPYSIFYNNETGTSNQLNNLTEGKHEINKLTSGTYSVIVTDAYGCKDSCSFEVETEEFPCQLEIEVNGSEVICSGDTSNIELTISNSNGNVDIDWNKDQFDGLQNFKTTVPGEYAVIVTDEQNCKDSAYFSIDTLPITIALIDTLLCPGDELIIGGQVFNQNNPMGVVRLPDMVANGCDSIIQVDIVYPLSTELKIQDVTPIENGDSVRLVGDFSGIAQSIYWIPPQYLSCDTCFGTYASPPSTEIYTLNITDRYGCIYKKEVTVEVVKKTEEVYIPNIFSPNGDGINDYFTVYAPFEDGQIKVMRIFDRWGGLLFEKRNIPFNEESVGWNGKSKNQYLSPGVFIYSITILTSEGNEKTFSGDITIAD